MREIPLTNREPCFGRLFVSASADFVTLPVQPVLWQLWLNLLTLSSRDRTSTADASTPTTTTIKKKKKKRNTTNCQKECSLLHGNEAIKIIPHYVSLEVLHLFIYFGYLSWQIKSTTLPGKSLERNDLDG